MSAYTRKSIYPKGKTHEKKMGKKTSPHIYELHVDPALMV